MPSNQHSFIVHAALIFNQPNSFFAVCSQAMSS